MRRVWQRACVYPWWLSPCLGLGLLFACPLEAYPEPLAPSVRLAQAGHSADADPALLYAEALAAYGAGDGASARAKLQALIARYPNDHVAIEARHRLIELHAKRGSVARATRPVARQERPEPEVAAIERPSSRSAPALPVPALTRPPALREPKPVSVAAPPTIEQPPRTGDGDGARAAVSPPGVTGRAEGNDFKIAVGDRVFFEPASASLGSPERAVLLAQAKWLFNRPTALVTLEAYADERGDRDLNLMIAQERAEAVRSFLARQGIASARIRIEVYGNERPVALCTQPAQGLCAAQNRRVVSVVEWPVATDPRRYGISSATERD